MLTHTTADSFLGLFSRQAESRADEAAVRFGGETLTYRQVDQWSGRIAAQLADCGVGPGSLVALAADRGPGPVIGVLAVLRAGAGYLALDPATPARRQRQMIQETAPDCVLAEPGLDQFPTLDAPRVRLARTDGGPVLPMDPRRARPTGEDVFHVVYTSGTTGVPKGVRISRRSVLNRLEWMWRDHPFAAGAVVAVQKSCSLVASPWELLGGLLQGVPSAVLTHEEVLDPALLLDAVERETITHLYLTPHLIRGLLDEADRRGGAGHQPVLVTSGADALPVETVRRFRRRFPATTLLNLYGMTETSSNVAAFDTARLAEGAERVPVGRPVAGAVISVRDRFQRVLPPGVTGEIWIAGTPLATGYVREDTADTDRFVRLDGVPHCRTGDRGRLLAEGDLDVVGRADTQVKIRGYRVELEEVEKNLAKAPGVTRAGAFVTEADTARGAEAELLACVTGGADLDTAAVRAFVRDRLPDYMVPSRLSVVPALPEASNGKVDRRLLPGLAERSRDPGHSAFAARDALESDVAAIWRELLGAAPADRSSNFFDAGGHSLLAVRFTNRLDRVLGIRVSLRQLLAGPTFDALVAICREKAGPAGTVRGD